MPLATDYVLGIDGGGTKTAAVILDGKGAERGRGEGGPCNIATCDDATLTTSLHEAVRAALAIAGLPQDTRFAATCAGVAGYTAKLRRAEFARLLAQCIPAEKHRVEPDYVVGYWGATEGGPGVVVSVGTGSVVYGRNRAGRSYYVGGRGYLLGDAGSGYWIGQCALKRVVLRMELTLPPDEFDRLVLEEIGAETLEDLIEWTYRDPRPARIAGLAEVVSKAAMCGYPHARELLAEAADSLANACALVFLILQMKLDEAPIYRIGGLWNLHPMMIEEFEKRLWEHLASHDGPPYPAFLSRPPKRDAAYGAALLALHETPKT
jgi:N-acetylglucosamine kinase-like BadF-type ATPase